MTLTVRELRKLTEEELIIRHDNETRATQVIEGGPLWQIYYLDELKRRDQNRQTQAMLNYTKWITIMTVIMTIATIINVILAFNK
ncbi:MAG: hypothetical protein AABZ11_05175 [Nitrospinota bacterium]